LGNISNVALWVFDSNITSLEFKKSLANYVLCHVVKKIGVLIIYSLKRNIIMTKRAEDLVYLHTNLHLLYGSTHNIMNKKMVLVEMYWI